MSVLIVRDALISVLGDKVGHYQARKDWTDKYAVFGETAAPTVVSADDEEQDLVLSGEIYYYTSEEYDGNVDEICMALSDAGVSWSVNAIGWDQELGQINYQIHWEVPCGAGEIYRQQ